MRFENYVLAPRRIGYPFRPWCWANRRTSRDRIPEGARSGKTLGDRRGAPGSASRMSRTKGPFTSPSIRRGRRLSAPGTWFSKRSNDESARSDPACDAPNTRHRPTWDRYFSNPATCHARSWCRFFLIVFILAALFPRSVCSLGGDRTVGCSDTFECDDFANFRS